MEGSQRESREGKLVSESFGILNGVRSSFVSKDIVRGYVPAEKIWKAMIRASGGELSVSDYSSSNPFGYVD